MSVRSTNGFLFLEFRFLVIFLTVSSSCLHSLHAQIATLPATLQLQEVDGVWTPWQNGMPVPSFEKQQRTRIDLAGAWRKQRFSANHDFTLDRRNQTGLSALEAEGGGRHSILYDDSGWETMIIPGVENQMNGYEVTPEYYENGVWYRRSFQVPDSLRDRFINLIFYSVNYVADVWLNNHYLGYHEGGYTPFAFSVGNELNYGGANVLAVRVDNPPWGSRKDLVPFYKVDWFNYTGIIHDVYLEAAAPAHIVRADVAPLSTDGTIRVTTLLYNADSSENNLTAQLDVFSAAPSTINLFTENSAELMGDAAAMSGESVQTLIVPASAARTWRTQLQITSPLLWWPKAPNLYVLRVTLKQQNRIVDVLYSQFGIRTVQTAGNRVMLNGKPIFLVGAARHEDHPFYGRAVPVNQIGDDLNRIKNLNVNFIRTAHYPNHPATYLFADRLGLVIMEEIPVWWFDNAEVWDIQNNQRHIHEQMWREMIFRDYNRPSILLWSTCNECLDVPNRKIFIERVHDDLDTRYADGRLVSQSAAADRPGPQDASQASCDVAGWTSYFGIFYGSDSYNDTKNFLNKVEIFYPNKPVLITEYGYWSSENGSSAAAQRNIFSNTFHALGERAMVSSSGQLNAKGFLMAATWWCAFDWYTCQQRNGFQSMGLYHMDRINPKSVAQSFVPAYQPYYEFGGATVVREQDAPDEFTLFSCYPNPFNDEARIAFSLTQRGHVRLELYNLLGQRLATLVDEERAAGHYEQRLQARGYGSGIYLVSLELGSQRHLHKLTLLK